MSTLAELEALAVIVEKLAPLAEAKRGELIRAEDWNTLVDCMLRTARAVLDDQPDQAAKHEHPGQVGFEWLDTKLQSILEQGLSGDPQFKIRMQELELAQANLFKQQTTVDERFNDLNGRLTRSQHGNARRDEDLRAIVKRIAGMSDSRDDLLKLHRDLGAMRDEVAKALEFAQNLDLGQGGINLRELRTATDQLEDFRKGFIDDQGVTLNARAINNQLQELRQTGVKFSELEEIIDLRIEAQPLLSSGSLQVINQAVQEEVEQRFSETETQFVSADQLSELVDSTLETRLTQRLTEAFQAFVTNELPGHIDAALSASSNFSTAQEAIIEERLAASRSAQTAAFEATLNKNLTPVQQLVQEHAGELSDLRLDPSKPPINLESLTKHPPTLDRFKSFGIKHVADVTAISLMKLDLILQDVLSKNDIRKLRTQATQLVSASN